jgi:hypothetical protein
MSGLFPEFELGSTQPLHKDIRGWLISRLRTTCPAMPVTLYITSVQQVLPASIRNLLSEYDVTEWEAYRRELLSYSKFRNDESF